MNEDSNQVKFAYLHVVFSLVLEDVVEKPQMFSKYDALGVDRTTSSKVEMIVPQIRHWAVQM